VEADVTDRRTFERTCDVCGRKSHRTEMWTTISFQPTVMTMPREPEDRHVCIRCRYELDELLEKLKKEKGYYG